MIKPRRLLPVLLAFGPSAAQAQVAPESPKPPLRRGNEPALPHVAAPLGARLNPEAFKKKAALNPATPPATANPAPAGVAGAGNPSVKAPPGILPAGKGPATPGKDDDEKRALDRTQTKTKKWKLKFDKVDIEELVKQISDMTGKLFILPENVRGKISIIGPEHGSAEVSEAEVYAAFLAALDANGLTLYQTGKFLRIEEKRLAKNSNIPTFLEDGHEYPLNEAMVTKLFRVKYVEAEPVRGVLANLVTQNGECVVFQPDLLICNDQGLNMHRLERVLSQLDTPGGIDVIRVVQVQYAAANDMADKITKIFEQKKGAPGQRAGSVQLAPNAKAPPAGFSLPTPPATGGNGDSPEVGAATLRLVIADERTNKLIIIANDRSFERIIAVVKELDVPTAGEGGVHVYYLQNAAAEELSNTLSNLAQGSGAKQPGAKGGQKNAAAELFAGEVKITAEKSTNSLVIIASDTDYRNLVKVIEKLDLSRREVFVEAVIMEVNLDHTNTFGARVHSGVPPISTSLFGANGSAVSLLADKFGNESLPPSFSLGSLASFGGFLAGIQGPIIPELKQYGLSVPSFGVVVHALEASSDVNVLSTPHILTTDNEEAEITVGQNVPFQAGFSPSSLSTAAAGAGGAASSLLAGATGGLGSLFAPIQRQNVELKLKIKPQINEGDLVRMVVDEQTEEIASQDPVLGPTTSKRTAKTTIVVRDQQTVVIGGLIQERTISSVNKVPILGDIPILGHLFREEQKHKLRTNLLLFLTPYIIRDQSDFQRIFQRKMKERQQFVEQFYGHDKQYEPYIDYTRKSGPLARMRAQLAIESDRVENGGTGSKTGERAILPRGRANLDPSALPPSLRPAGPEVAPPPPATEPVPAPAPAPAPAPN
jgi:general secretion pathway protein D